MSVDVVGLYVKQENSNFWTEDGDVTAHALVLCNEREQKVRSKLLKLLVNLHDKKIVYADFSEMSCIRKPISQT